METVTKLFVTFPTQIEAEIKKLTEEQNEILKMYGWKCKEDFVDARDFLRHKAFLKDMEALIDLGRFKFLSEKIRLLMIKSGKIQAF